jgi:hypothetical protein
MKVSDKGGVLLHLLAAECKQESGRASAAWASTEAEAERTVREDGVLFHHTPRHLPRRPVHRHRRRGLIPSPSVIRRSSREAGLRNKEKCHMQNPAGLLFL